MDDVDHDTSKQDMADERYFGSCGWQVRTAHQRAATGLVALTSTRNQDEPVRAAVAEQQQQVICVLSTHTQNL